MSNLSESDAAGLLFDWDFWARPKQREPDSDWQVWFVQTGRGWGKTLTGAQTVRKRAEAATTRHIALVGPTAADVRDVMVESESGVVSISPPWFPATYQPSKRRVTWPNGVTATMYSAEDPDQLRGPQHGFAWCDEIASWPKAIDVWDNLMFGLRKDEARTIITSTPRPNRIIRMLRNDPTTVITRGHTYENAMNLSPAYLARNVKPYEGTRKGRQEIYGEVLEDTPGALWTYDLIDASRVTEAPALLRIVTAIDPAVTSNPESSNTGIVTVGLSEDKHLYVLGDATVNDTPDRWAKKAIQAFGIHQADRIIGERNNGGELVEAMLRAQDELIPYTSVFASRGKIARAEPISALYEQGRVHHVGTFKDLEDEMVEFVGGERNLEKDRVDALVWACSHLMPNAGSRLRLPLPDPILRPLPILAGLRSKVF